jgi:hypothetical protein
MEKIDMIDASEAVIWVNVEARLVMVWQHCDGCPDGRSRVRRWTGPGHWVDPIGAAYTEWRKMKNPVRVRLMTETAIDLAMQGIPLKNILIAFAQVTEFRALGSEKLPHGPRAHIRAARPLLGAEHHELRGAARNL